MIRFNKARLVGVRLVVLSFVLAAFTGLSAQNDTTFVANGNPIIKYKYVGDSAAMVHDGKVYIYDGHDECPPLNEHYLINEWCVFFSRLEDMDGASRSFESERFQLGKGGSMGKSGH